MLLLASAALACTCFPKAVPIPGGGVVPTNAVLRADIPTYWTRNLPETVLEIDGVVRAAPPRTEVDGDRTILTFDRHWPRGARVRVLLRGEGRVTAVLDVRIGERADHEAPAGEGEISGTLVEDRSCPGGRALVLDVPVDPHVVAWGAWTVGTDGAPSRGEPRWIVPVREGEIVLGSTLPCVHSTFQPADAPSLTLDLVPLDAAGNPGPVRRVEIDTRYVRLR